MRVDAADGRCRALDLGRADVRGAVDHLPLQVRQRDRIVVDDAERAHPGSREIHERRRAEPAGADDQDTRALERGLTRSADFVQYDVAGVTFEFFRTEHGGAYSISKTGCFDVLTAGHHT